MKTIWNTLYGFYTNWLHPTFVSLITFLTDNQYAIYVIVAALIALAIVNKYVLKKLKVQTLSKLSDFITGVVVILLIIVVYNIFSPNINNFLKPSTDTDSSTSTKTTPKSTTGTESTPTQTTPSTTTTKQLYYGGGCSGCYADGCPRDGYSYGGYDVNMYNYYRSLCQVCQCTSLRWQSLWR